MPALHDRALALKAKLFRGLADPSRLGILEALRHGERTVSELVEVTGLSQPNASAHLACLRDCGLVTSRKAGRFIYYQLADTRVEAVLHDAEGILAGNAERICRCSQYETPSGMDDLPCGMGDMPAGTEGCPHGN